jgi:hypothetical protein
LLVEKSKQEKERSKLEEQLCDERKEASKEKMVRHISVRLLV